MRYLRIGAGVCCATRVIRLTNIQNGGAYDDATFEDTPGGDRRHRHGTRGRGARRNGDAGASAGRAQDVRTGAWLLGWRLVLSPRRRSFGAARSQGVRADVYRP